MTLTVRKMLIVGFVAVILVLANAWAIAAWLDHVGLISWACGIRGEYLTGTVIAVIAAFLILCACPSRRDFCSLFVRRCGVCDHVMLRRGRYCPMCGSRV